METLADGQLQVFGQDKNSGDIQEKGLFLNG
jgi:hypothetical protein